MLKIQLEIADEINGMNSDCPIDPDETAEGYPMGKLTSAEAATCPRKQHLLAKYIAALSIYNKEAGEHSGLPECGVVLTIKKRSLRETRKGLAAALKRYTDHVQEHRCAIRTE